LRVDEYFENSSQLSAVNFWPASGDSRFIVDAISSEYTSDDVVEGVANNK
jgi:hypothetical protein